MTTLTRRTLLAALAAVIAPPGGTSAKDTTKLAGVGLWFGQSNAGKMVWWGTPFSTYPTIDRYASLFINPTWRSPLPTGGNPGGGTGIATWVNTWRAQRVADDPNDIVPFRMIGHATGAQTISHFDAGGDDWRSIQLEVATALAGRKDDKITWTGFWQGEANCGGRLSSGYAAALTRIVANCAKLAGHSDYRGFGIVQIAAMDASGNNNDIDCSVVRRAQMAQALKPGCFLLATTLDCDAIVHLAETADGYGRVGLRAANALLYLEGRRAYPSIGPGIVSGYWIPGTRRLRLLIAHGSGGNQLRTGDGGTTGKSLSGFTITVNGSTVAHSASAFNGNDIDLIMPGARIAGEPVTVDYGLGLDPFNRVGLGYAASVAKIVFDNNGIGQGGALAGRGPGKLGDTKGFMLRPTPATITVIESPIP